MEVGFWGKMLMLMVEMEGVVVETATQEKEGMLEIEVAILMRILKRILELQIAQDAAKQYHSHNK